MLVQRGLVLAGFIVAFPIVAVIVLTILFFGGIRAIWYDKSEEPFQ